MSNITIIRFLLILGLLCLNCSDKKFGVTGRVISSTSAKPIQNAEVCLSNSVSKHIYKNTMTDSVGYFIMPEISNQLLDSTCLIVAKDGYADTILNIDRKSNLLIKMRPIYLRFSNNIEKNITTPNKDEIRILNFHNPSGSSEYWFKVMKEGIIRTEYAHLSGVLLHRDTLLSRNTVFRRLDSLLSLFNQGTYRGIIGTDPNPIYISNSNKTICCINCILPEDTLSDKFRTILQLIMELTKKSEQ